MKFKTTELDFDLIVCGAGMSGICAAIQAARIGLKTALVNNRGVLGGNAGPEIRIHVCGATGTSEFNLYAKEGGVLNEILAENRHRNPQGNVYLWHTVLIDALRKEKNISVFLNTNIDTVNMDGTKIIGVEGSQIGSEKHYKLNADMFIDDTGDGTIGYLAGADYMYGRESSDTWGEKIAPEVADKDVLLSSLSFYTKDFHRDMPFELPEFAQDIKEKFEKSLDYREIPDRMPLDTRYDGFRFQWYYETGAGRNQVTDNEEVIDDHNKLLLNVWDYIKNRSDYEASQFDLEYISPFPGKRESRRLVGEYILKEQDVALQTDFEDTIAYGGWSIDLHAVGGFFSTENINKHYYLRGIYQVPFRSVCVKGVDNLMVASRCLSVSHVASGTTRIMATLSMLGQACAMASGLCKEYGMTPAEIGKHHIEDLQQRLMNADQYIVGKKKKDSLITKANVSTSSFFGGEIAHTNTFMPLDKGYGFTMPVSAENEKINLYFKASKDTTLNVAIYKPGKKENYGPFHLLGEFDFDLKQSEVATQTTVDISSLDYDKNVFMVFTANSDVEMEVSDENINGFRMFMQRVNDEPLFYDIDTLDVKPYFWIKVNTLPVFENKTNIYDSKTLTNGYIRNYAHPNLWISDLSDTAPEISIDLPEAHKLNSIKFTFDDLSSDINYDNLETFYESNVWESVVKDYEVYAKVNGEYVLVKKVEGNYKKVNTIDFNGIETDSVKVKLLSTNGAKRFAIYDISLA